MSAAGLGAVRDTAVSRQDRVVPATEAAHAVRARIEAAAAANTAARAAVRRGEQAVVEFEREHRKLVRALAGVDRLAASAGGRLDRALLVALEELHYSPAFTLGTYGHMMDDGVGEALELPSAATPFRVQFAEVVRDS